MIEQCYFVGAREAVIRGLPAEGVWAPNVLAAHPIPVGLDLVVDAYVNHGRWLANCPYCSGAEKVSTDYPTFWCDGCGMSKAQGQAAKVIFPAAREFNEIEAELGRRPANRQHWSRAEMPEGVTAGAWLRAENIVHGITGAEAKERIEAKAIYWGESAVKPELKTASKLSADHLEAKARGKH